MVLGKVAEWMSRLDKGQSVVITYDDLYDSARYYMDSAFDHVRQEYIDQVVLQVESNEYPEFGLFERPDGRWTLERK